MIIEKAQELGIALSESREFHRLLDAKAAMDANQRVQSLLSAYNGKRDTIVQMMENDQGERESMLELGQQLDQIQSDLMGDPVFQEMLEAQQAFQSLMRQVNKEIAACIGMDTLDEGDETGELGCSGDCTACAGCKH